MLDRLERVARGAGAALAAIGAVLIVPGLVASARESGPVVGRPELVLTPVRLAALAAGWVTGTAVLWRPLPLRPGPAQRLALLAVGAPACLGGLLIAIWGCLALGGSHRVSSSVGVRIGSAHRLVVTGPYAHVRHPMYLGLAIAAVGSLLLYRTWATLLFVVQAPTLVRRTRLEEVALAAAFGQAWIEYRDRVPAWLPRWPRGIARLAPPR